jgi:hypothetical protein
MNRDNLPIFPEFLLDFSGVRDRAKITYQPAWHLLARKFLRWRYHRFNSSITNPQRVGAPITNITNGFVPGWR